MSKVFIIHETKPATYSYRIYAKNKKEALEKFNGGSQDYVEIGLSHSGPETTKQTIEECGPAVETCANCGLEFSAKSVRDIVCMECKK